jgi:carboxymethylenebutenolidase
VRVTIRRDYQSGEQAIIEQERILQIPGGGRMRIFAAHPEGSGPFPLAVIFMDATGYREEIKEHARRFGAGGYYCVAPDLWHHFGEDVTFDMYEIAAAGFKGPEIERMFELVEKLSPPLVTADTEAVIAAAADDPAAGPGPKVCIGYCMGARFALNAASKLPGHFVAAAGIHPGPIVTDRPDSPHHDLDTVHGELYFAFASKDAHAPPEMVERLRREMADRHVIGDVVTMPGTYHGFAMADGPAYAPAAAEEHYERTLELWHRSLARHRSA